MNAPRYLISTTFQGRKRTRTWDSSEPVMLGKSEKGPLWVLERTSKGTIRVRSLATGDGQVSNAHSQILSQEQLKRGVQVRFKKKEGHEIAIEIKSLVQIHPSLYRQADENADLTRGFSVYHCVNDWTSNHSNHKTDFVARYQEKDMFHVMAQGNEARLRPIQPGLIVEINGTVQKMDSIAEFNIHASDFFKTTVKFGVATWYFAPYAEGRRDILFEVPPQGALDGANFIKGTLTAAATILVALGLNFLVPKKEEPEKPIPEQIVKVIETHIQRPKKQPVVAQAEVAPEEPKKAAPEAKAKLEIPAEKQPEPQKALAQSEKVEKVQPDKVIIPKGKAGGGKKMAAVVPNKPAASAPVRAPVKPTNRAENLFKGVLRGGLTKIVDSPSLADVSKRGSGVNFARVDGRGVAGDASAAINVNLGAGGGGGGFGDGKVAGFGGDSNAGSRGPATPGYGSGVKGAPLSGTGGTQISLGEHDADVEEGLTKEEVGRVIHAHMKEIRYCMEHSMVRTSRVDGKVILDFTINAGGRVSRASDRKPASIPDPSLADCIMRRLKTWQFPYPKGGVNVDVSYPFIFKTLGG